MGICYVQVKLLSYKTKLHNNGVVNQSVNFNGQTATKKLIYKSFYFVLKSKSN